jgi:hypothetical protein
MVMIFSVNMVGRLVFNGQLRWWGQRRLAMIATAEEGNSGDVNGGGRGGGEDRGPDVEKKRYLHRLRKHGFVELESDGCSGCHGRR